jgi:hypothetical protein
VLPGVRSDREEARIMTRDEFWRINVLVWAIAALGVASILSVIWP